MLKKFKLWVVCALAIGALAPIASAQEITEPYDFPVRPGTEEWVALGSHEARLKACEIPTDILSRMTTGALVKTCMAYPFGGSVALANDLKLGAGVLLTRFNGLQELVQRPDAGIELVDFYETVNVLEVPSCGISDGRVCLLELIYLESLVIQDNVLVRLGPNEHERLLRAGLRVYEAKSSDSRYSTFSLSVTARLMTESLSSVGRPVTVGTAATSPEDALQAVVDATKRYLNRVERGE